VKTIAGLCAVIFLLGSLFAEAQAQQNMGTPRKGTGMGQVPPSFYTPTRPKGFITGPKTIGGSPQQWGTFQTAPGARNRQAKKKTN
jgi:hypothetical protein